MKAITLRGIFLFILLIPSLAQAYTETFYVCDGGNGSAPETANCATAYDEADFNSSGNWSSSDANDGKIGPNDVVYFMDAGGDFDIELLPRASGTSGKPITLMPYAGDRPVFSPSSGSAFQIDRQHITLDCAGDSGNESMTLYSADSPSNSPIIQGYSGGDTTDYLTVNGCTLIGPGPNGCGSSTFMAGVHIRSDHFTLTNNEVSHTNLGLAYEVPSGDTGVHYGLFSGNYLHDFDCPSAGTADGILSKNLNDSAATADQTGVVIEKNRIVNWKDDAVDTIWSYGQTIRENEIGPVSGVGGGDCNGLKLGGARSYAGSQTVTHNYIHDLNWTSCGGNEQSFGINTNGSSGQTIAHNIIYNIADAEGGGGYGIMLNGNAHNGQNTSYKVYNNVIYGEKRGIGLTSVATGGTHLIKNNIVSGGSYDINISSSRDNFEGGYNILVNDTSVGGNYSGGSNDFGRTAPGFTNQTNRDFTLRADSPAVDAGAYMDPSADALLPGSDWPSGVIAVDPYMDGTQREIGAFIYDGNGGVSNPVDNCPSDPAKTQPGICGCGVSDADSDRDGIPNCNDNCPSGSNANQADSDGDGIGDVCDASTSSVNDASDIDGDGLTTLVEYNLGTDPYNIDTDNDGIVDGYDGYPLNGWRSSCRDLIQNDLTLENYTTIQAAIDDPDAVDLDTIQITAAEFGEDIFYYINTTLTLSGGYNCDFSDNPFKSSINSLTIRNGTTIVDNLVIN